MRVDSLLVPRASVSKLIKIKEGRQEAVLRVACGRLDWVFSKRVERFSEGVFLQF